MQKGLLSIFKFIIFTIYKFNNVIITISEMNYYMENRARIIYLADEGKGYNYHHYHYYNYYKKITNILLYKCIGSFINHSLSNARNPLNKFWWFTCRQIFSWFWYYNLVTIIIKISFYFIVDTNYTLRYYFSYDFFIFNVYYLP